MFKKILTLTYFLFLNTSLSAMDLNETMVIINEATQATKTLQDEFYVLTNEVIPPIQEKVLEVNSTNIETVHILDIPEVNATTIMVHEVTEAVHDEFDVLINNPVPPIQEKTIEVNLSNTKIINIVNSTEVNTSSEFNKSVEINNTFPIQELNSTQRISCKENLIPIDNNKTSNLNYDDNNSIADNGCTDTGIEGSSIRGLIIFKTRIKPTCKMNGEEFAKQYMQEDWDDIYHEKELKMEVLKACPQIEKRYKDKWGPHLYQFVLEYASDSDAIPEC